ncbi:Lysophospholipase, alpha-beta hydrolase superfamily [Clostridium cavendishii DSM 21758]|uniref:Lysophospholipase, alpha-beta hydrolase superfamily n=1 Tax=Clostridium cavendishii DSM 21758 TaxID=1121302 RepID=A0A1M6UH44_9CLOT|nr:alpha/beta fold hydrolase [Clostridium cavendishii]SHK68534.1 Lysophospholipase, alpha-beta hydrolase superfamily [Clostridium cavendishii DSM 21758]
MKKDKITFAKGIYNLNDEDNFNFQLNRIIMWNEGNLEDIKRISHKIKDSATWKKELIIIGNQAVNEGRIKEAIAYYRMSEFFMYDDDKDKIKYYKLASDMFYKYYEEYFEDGTVVKYEVPYEEVKLPVLYTKAVGDKKDTILLHGGNDSYMEELFFAMLYFAENGFDVYLFEGPGQGNVMRIQKKHFTHEWEKPVTEIINYFDLYDVTIIGASLGGMLAPRAAAYEERIKRVIAWSIFPNFLSVILSTMPDVDQKILRRLMKMHAAPIINMIFNIGAKKDSTVEWALKHGMYAYNAKSPYEYTRKLDKFKITDVGHLINQDILIIGATEDHFINYNIFKDELECLSKVASLTFRLFTRKENASNHCNMGNTKLTLDTMINWIERIKM